jgi:hypothetical protein
MLSRPLNASATVRVITPGRGRKSIVVRHASFNSRTRAGRSVNRDVYYDAQWWNNRAFKRPMIKKRLDEHVGYPDTYEASIDRHEVLYRLPRAESINRTYPSSAPVDKWQRDIVDMTQVLVVRRSMESREKIGACRVVFARTLGDETLDAPTPYFFIGWANHRGFHCCPGSNLGRSPAVRAEARAGLGGLLFRHLQCPSAQALFLISAG